MTPAHHRDVPALAPGEVAVGIDIGGTKTLATAYTSQGAVASARRRTLHGQDGLLVSVDEVLAELAGALPATAEFTLRAIGIGIPGVVSPTLGTVANGVNVGIGAEALPLAGLVAERTGVPVHLENDVAAATLGAAHALGVGDDVALISLGTGLAAGMVLDGVPRTGSRGSAGEIGHIPYREDGPLCPCGQHGCLELYASGRALAGMWDTDPATRPVTDLLRSAHEGDPRARTVLDQWMGAVAHAVTLVGLGVDVAAILIGGGVSEAGQPFLEELQDTLRSRARDSGFLTQMDLASRLVLVPPDLEVATLGACLAALRSPG